MESQFPVRAERRETDRFPIESDLRYRLMLGKRVQTEGAGRTRNMSSGGALFTVESRLPAGHRVEVTVDWPAQLHDGCGLKLVACGRVVRSDAQIAAIQIEKYDFRTRATRAFASRA